MVSEVKFEDIADWAKDRYGIDILDKEDIAWRTKYPNIAKRIDDLEQRLHRIEVEEERHKGDGK
jgi:polyhydroxyalkanoate synthesis regulator phasin